MAVSPANEMAVLSEEDRAFFDANRYLVIEDALGVES